MTLQQAIEASDYKAVITEYGSMYTSVDGSALDGNFSISTGAQGYPPTEHQKVSGIDAAIKVIEEKGLLDQNWEAIEGEE